jgi:hypothetical protein
MSICQKLQPFSDGGSKKIIVEFITCIICYKYVCIYVYIELVHTPSANSESWQT